MPDSPAPTIRTSTCSTMARPLRRSGSGRSAGELVVQRALLTEHRRPPLRDQRRGVAVVRVEVGAVVVPQLVPQLALHDRRTAHLAPALAEIATLEGRLVREQRDADLQHHAADEAD